MLTDLQIKWIEELRSGKYTQAQAQLMTQTITRRRELIKLDHYAYCCLGVAYHLIRPYNETNCSVLPEEDYKLLGLRTHDGALKYPVHTTVNGKDRLLYSLTTLNDKAKWTFLDIGNYIWAHPNNVFVGVGQNK